MDVASRHGCCTASEETFRGALAARRCAAWLNQRKWQKMAIPAKIVGIKTNHSNHLLYQPKTKD